MILIPICPVTIISINRYYATPNVFDFMQTYNVRHDGDNMFEHSVKYAVLNLDIKKYHIYR